MERRTLVRIALVLAAGAALANLPGAPQRAWPLELFSALLWLCVGAVLLRPPSERTAVRALGVIAVFALAAHVDFGRMHGGGRPLHTHELYNYYQGSKYFPELGYDGHYLATHRALVDNDPAYFEAIQQVKNLRTYRLEGRAVSLQRSESVAARFTAERWEEFRGDVAFFQRTLPPATWPYLMVDHGYNATPFWTLLGRALSTRVQLAGGALELLAALDLVLLLAAFALARFGFGTKAALCFAIFHLAGFPDAFAFVGGAFLRLVWLTGVVGFAACLRRGRPALAGVLLAVAALDRVFPAVLLLVPAVAAARALAARRPIPRAAWRCLGAFAAAALALGAASGYAVGDVGSLPVWRDCIANLAAHSRWYFANQLSLRTLFLVDVAATWDMVRAGWDETAWLRERQALDAATRGTLFAVRVGLGALIARRIWTLARGGGVWRGLGIASLLPFVLLYPASYYSLFLGLAFLCVRVERRLALALVGVNVLAFLLRARLATAVELDLLHWGVSLLIFGALVAGLGPLPRPRLARAAPLLLLVLAGVAVDVVRARRGAPPASLDLAAEDVATRGARAENQRMAPWGSGWARDDQVGIVTSDTTFRATVAFEIAPGDAPGDGPRDLRVELTAAPPYGIVALDLDGRPLGTVDLYSPFPAPRAFVAPRLALEPGPRELGIALAGANPAASGRHAGIDRIVVQPSRAPETALDRALTWVLAHPADLFDGGRKDVLRELVALERLRDEPALAARRAEIEQAARARVAKLNGYRGDWALTPEAETLAAGAHAARRLGTELALLSAVAGDLREWSRPPYAGRSIVRPSALHFALARLEVATPRLDERGSALAVAGRELLALVERPHDRRDAARLRELVAAVAADLAARTDLGRVAPATLPFERPELERLCGESLARLVEIGDVLGVARMLGAVAWLEVDVGVHDARRFLLEQQTASGSFGRADAAAPNPEREATLSALLAL